MKLYKGHAMIVGRKSEHSLYRHELATYEEGDQYDASAAQGFIKIHGLVADHPGQAPDAQGHRRRHGSSCPASSRRMRRGKAIKGGSVGFGPTPPTPARASTGA